MLKKFVGILIFLILLGVLFNSFYLQIPLFVNKTAGKPVAKELPRFTGTVNIGLLANITSPVATFAKQSVNAGNLAVDEINAAGGILGKKVNLIIHDTQLNPELASQYATKLIDKDKAVLLVHDSNTKMALAIGKVAKDKRVLFMCGAGYSPIITGAEAHRYIFRTGFNSTMQAKALASYLNRQYKDKTYVYITWDYIWGWSTEANLRKYTKTTDRTKYKQILIPYPNYTKENIVKAVQEAKKENPDVLVVTLYGDPMIETAKAVYDSDMKKDTRIVLSTDIPYEQVIKHGVDVFEHMITSTSFIPKVPLEYDYQRGQEFVDDFVARYNLYPGETAAGTYTSIYQYKSAVEKAGSFNVDKVVSALEGHKFSLVKGQEYYRDFDHQNVQQGFVIKFKSVEEFDNREFDDDKWNILRSDVGDDIVTTREEWEQVRKQNNKPLFLEPRLE